jgi:hypothetical protein
VSKYITVSHKEVMNEKFKVKKDIFTEFGVADKKDEFDGTEVWTFNLAERSSGGGSSVNFSQSVSKQNKNNLNLKPVDRIIENSSNGITNTTFSSTTKMDYLTFWFENDTVIKWESLGYDASYIKPNKEFNQIKYNQYIKQRSSRRYVIVFLPVVLVLNLGLFFN